MLTATSVRNHEAPDRIANAQRCDIWNNFSFALITQAFEKLAEDRKIAFTSVVVRTEQIHSATQVFSLEGPEISYMKRYFLETGKGS